MDPDERTAATMRAVGTSAAETMDALEAGLADALREYVPPLETVVKEMHDHGLERQSALSMLIGFCIAATEEEFPRG